MMDATLVVTIAAWIWVVLGLGLFGFLCFLVAVAEVSEEPPALLVAPAGVLAIGSMVVPLHLLGYSGAALWVWRILGAVNLIVGVFMSAKTERTPWLAVGAAASVAVALFMGGAPWIVSTMVPPIPALPPLAPLAPPAAITIPGVTLWHSVALGMLAIGTVVFVGLFIRKVERGSTPQVERHWGGIGGGMGGWRMSASLTYLAAAIVFGVLFAMFVFQLELKPAR